MAATFARINAVAVDPQHLMTDTGLYPDPQLQPGGSFSSNVVPIVGPTASYGQLWRGMGIALNPATGFLVPPSASGAVPMGILVDDLTSYVLARGVKITFAKRGRVRTYAGAAMTVGQNAKIDTSANFCGVVPWVKGTDDPSLIVGKVAPLDDGSAENGASATTAINQGDTIFVDLLVL